MSMTIALVGNPNCGKTTMFNDLTGSAQYVGNWPGVTVEKKEGKLRGRKDIKIMDLPGIYSLSPYTLEEVVTRNYLIDEKPDAIINIVDASNLERNLYLTTQIMELGIPVIIALNMIDVIRKKGDKIDVKKLEKTLGCPIIETSASKGEGLPDLIQASIDLANNKKANQNVDFYNNDLLEVLNKISSLVNNYIDDKSTLLFYSVKLFEGDEKIIEKLKLPSKVIEDIKSLTSSFEDKMDDDSESIITNSRYEFIQNNLSKFVKKAKEQETMSDKIDKVVTSKWLALPIFFGIMWIIYYISISTVGDWTIGWVENLFGWLGDKATFLLEKANSSDMVKGLVVDGIIGNLGAIFIYVPQLMILFLFLSFLEDSGYMARVAFIMDRLFRKFGLSGKSFIPMLIGTGCSVPGIMATRTIENDRDRKMTIMLTPFIPCGAKLPIFALFAATIFSDYSWVGPSIYLIAIVAVILSGLILKKTKLFKGDVSPFIMELPTYKLPNLKNLAIHMWEKAKSFVKKAGSIIFIACVVVWFLQSFDTSFNYGVDIEDSMLASFGNLIKPILAPLGLGDSWAPAVATTTGFLAKEVVVTTLASVAGDVGIGFTMISAFAFMIFSIFASPCFAAIGAMKRELGSLKWTLIAIAYQTGLAYILGTLVNVIGNLIFKGTKATETYYIKASQMVDKNEEFINESIIDSDIVMIIFGSLLAIALIVVIYNTIKSRRRYRVQQ